MRVTMPSARTTWGPLAALVVLFLPVVPAFAQSASIDPSVVTFLKTYCVRCHGPEKQNASLRFDTMPVALADEAVAQQWQDILDVLNLDEMPPADERRPGDDELSLVLETLTGNLREARERLNAAGGQAVLRRMNRREYRNTIRALFGLDVPLDAVPDDETVDGFDTIATAHTFSSLHLERYLSTGGNVMNAFVSGRGRTRPPEVLRYEPETVERSVNANLVRERSRIAAPGSRRPSRNGEVHRSDFEMMKSGMISEYLDHPASKTGVMVPWRGLVPSVKSVSPLLGRNGWYKVRVRCGIDAPQPVDGVFLELRRVPRQTNNVDRIDRFEVRGTIDEPQVIEFETIVDGVVGNYVTIARRSPRADVLPRFEEYAAEDPRYLTRVGDDILRLADDEGPNVWVDWIETEGPFPRFEGMLDPRIASLSRRATDDDAREMIERFAFEAFRRQRPPEEFVDRVLDVYRITRENGADVTAASRECLKIVLASPRFLFLYEPSTDGEKRSLTDRELAVRLSYFLWSGPPDEALYRAAEAGELSTPKGLAAQLDRMLDSEKSQEFVANFVTQFLELDRLDNVSPEATTVPEYDGHLQDETRREVVEFFRHLLEEDRPAYDMIDADYVVVNALLADFYGLPDVHGDEFRPVPLPADSPRGGLLGQSAILTLTGTGERTSPVERGAFVLRKILNRPPPPAPANVPMLEEGSLGNRSIRETLRTHMTKPQCSSCHRRIDPLGFGLENFDPVGRWRESVPSVDGTTTFPIEPAGLMPDGERRFDSSREMKRLMMGDRDDFLTGLTKAVMTYGIGRKVGYADQVEVERIERSTAERGYGLRTLLHEIVQSEPFRTK